jgi:low temperature requirement protein LtrA
MYPVCPRSECAEETERRASWMELFYDLVFVAAISSLAQALYQHSTWLGIAQFILLFTALWSAWVAGTFYADRFDSDDPYHRCMYFAQMLCIVFVALFIQHGFEEKSQQLAITYTALWVLITLLYTRVVVGLRSSRPVIGKLLCGVALSATIWVISILVPPPWRFICWIVALLIYIFTPVVLRETLARSQAALSATHLPERFALFTIIVLGETIASTIHGIELHELTPLAVATTVFGLLLAFGVWQLYFKDISMDLHANKYSLTLHWELAHLPLLASIVGFSVAIRLAITHDFHLTTPQITLFIVSLCLATIMLKFLYHLRCCAKTKD